ncbi:MULTISPECIES: TolC family protein [unclassified Arcicella]|uniref:TolC family protein n=1 Tax=unclassified Arcicella TaxID=2644986 RepID=UPI0028615A68|nr:MULTISPECIES: TolC family protein [unclassified Arcicella]MDR6563368.1 outer membrane protein TolC [Arcicella sp. BE51]MDR6813211.1 outer membrane protein TolC [Arcicella sp. BE140]MDR6824525.1 outer membrane protein TolC [Arcicella sp. BE139]
MKTLKIYANPFIAIKLANNKVVLLLLVSISFLIDAKAQSDILNQYVQEGLKNSQIIKQQQFSLQKAVYALEEAKALFKPNVSFNTTVSAAQGGRKIEIPVGDLVNPVYTTLNALTNSNKFPQISNTSEQLVPKDFYDLRFKTTMPILNAEIRYNQAIKKEQITVQQTEIQVYKRELVRDIKAAYFNYLKATEAVKVYENALKILQESERVNESLIKNGSANPTVLVRTRNEIAKIDAEISNAKGNQLNAAAYFNFLLNKDFSSNIVIENLNTSLLDLNLEDGHREELDKIQAGININKQLVGLSQSYKKLKVGASLDVGSQGRFAQIASADKNFFSPNAFVLVGVSFDLPVYSFGRNQLKVKQSEMDLAALDTQAQQVKNQLALQTEMAQNSLSSSKKVFESKASQISTAERYYRDMLRRYKEGNLSFIELLDAQTQITTAQLQQSISLYDVWLKWTDLERAKASYEIK